MPQIKDVFDVDKVVKEHGQKILLLGGVGSGKSRYVIEVLSKKGNVLFVTSRKAKVLEDESCSSFSQLFKWHTNENQTLVTNAKLAKMVERIADDYMQDLDEFIDHFDYIVVDEIHSVATDSAYAESCAAVLSFVEYACIKEKTIICMTGTPEPIQSYFDKNGWHTQNYIDVCNYVHPKRVSLIKERQIVKYIKTHYKDSKIIYFANKFESIQKICRVLLDDGEVCVKDIAISVSANREKTFFEELKKVIGCEAKATIIQENSKSAYASIISRKMLPDDCKVLFSTSVLKEGINISNSDVIMFCENHVLSNLVQYFGRVRCGNGEVYVIEDADDHPVKNSELLYSYAEEAEIKAANQFYKDRVDQAANLRFGIERHKLIEHVTKNPYIYFDYIQNEYRLFDVKYYEELRLKAQYFWKSELLNHCKKYGIEYRWFDANIQQDALLDLAKKQKKFFGKQEKQVLLQLLYSAYGIKAKQPAGINSVLEEKNLSIRIHNGKGSAGKERNQSFWQLFLVKDYETLQIK